MPCGTTQWHNAISGMPVPSKEQILHKDQRQTDQKGKPVSAQNLKRYSTKGKGIKINDNI
jgi:hypothetical protein